MRNPLNLIRHDEDTRTRVASYGIDPTTVEEYLLEREWHVNDPTADAAIAKVMAESNAASQKRR